MAFSLLQITQTQLRQMAACGVPSDLSDRLEPNALPPAFVAQRALRLLAQGNAEVWSCSYLIVRAIDDRIVGGCGFKIAPHGGRVEIGYGVSPESRGQGAATAAVRQLIDIAFSSGANSVVAEVSPQNHASTRVVQKLGFTVVGSRVDEEGEHVVQWVVASDA
ncbi:MAG: GNAT family N-acetyltransferase [Rubrivivax sp.]|nr:GNAT family N-acetyltransferase [Rubrivivax sp.]